MRQGQQNRRGRGRNNNNSGRKGQNPLTRSFESNGPDMKIRGTPAHVAEKYMSLARDALSAGDPVLAENYLQHAEHYNRIILTYREQQSQQHSDSVNGAMNAHSRGAGNNGAQADSERAEGEQGGTHAQPDAPQPATGSEQGPRERTSRNPRHDRGRSGRGRGAGGQRSGGRSGGANGSGAEAAGDAAQASDQSDAGRKRDRFGEGDDQPQFLRRPVRRPRQESSGDETAPRSSAKEAAAPVGDDSQD